MALFFHLKLNSNKRIVYFVADQVLRVWTKARIPTIQKTHVADKVEKLTEAGEIEEY